MEELENAPIDEEKNQPDDIKDEKMKNDEDKDDVKSTAIPDGRKVINN